jgi:pimeloyl-ACP methyl ester carboxylesterase
MAAIIASSMLLGAGALYYIYSYLSPGTDGDGGIPEESDHPLLKDHSTIRSYTTRYATYPSIRTFYHPHAHTKKLQAIADLPLLVFIHGLGGSLPQFAPLLGSLVNVGPCFGLELPGHGSSRFAPKDFGAYTIDAFSALWRQAIEDICREHGHQKVVLIAHSMGCSLAALLATGAPLIAPVVGIVAMCPKATPPPKSQTINARILLSLPDFLLDLLRMIDRRGGIDSKSVKRMAGEAAGADLRRTQLAFNKRFKTPIWKRSTLGCLPRYDASGDPHGGLPGKETWEMVQVPLFLVAGEADTVTSPREVAQLASFLQHPQEADPTPASTDSTLLPNTDASEEPKDDAGTSFAQSSSSTQADERQYGSRPCTTEISSHNSKVVKTAILPAPAAHALM